MYVMSERGVNPPGVTSVIGGQTLRFQLIAEDMGAGDGWLFEIPRLDISERVLPGQTVRLEVTPQNYNNNRVEVSSGNITHTAVLRVAPPRQ